MSARARQSITEYNGAALVAMSGKNCVAIASDLRLGVRGQTVAMNFQKVFPMGDKLYLGLAGLATDVQTLCGRARAALATTPCLVPLTRGQLARPYSAAPADRAQQFQYRTNVYRLKEDRDIKPITFAQMVSSALYERRYAHGA